MDGTGRPASTPAAVTGEAQAVLSHALKVAASLLCTWGIALAVRFILPRYLGPAAYGAYSFADAFAMTFFVFASLGLDTYVQRELPVRPQHASDFFAGTLALRVLSSALLLAVMWIVLVVTGRPVEVQAAALLFGVGQLFFVQNSTFIAMLNARGTVDGMSVVNVLSKTSWGLAVLLAVWQRWPFWTLGAAFALSELVRAGALYVLCKRHLSLVARFDWPTVFRVTRVCVPFFMTTLALTLYSRLDVTLLGYLTDDLEVGWYAAASMVSSLGLLLAPLITGVLLPMFARARARSEEELTHLVRRSLELVLALCAPVALILFLCADVFILLASGQGYEPAAMALRAIAPIFALTYLAMLCASVLNLLGREWTVTRICMVGLVVNPLLNLALIRPMLNVFGPGGGGVGAAIASVATEAVICGVMLYVIGRRTVDRRLIRVMVRTAAVCVCVAAVDYFARSFGMARVLVDGVAYVVFAVAFKSVDLAEVKALIARRKESAA